MIQGLVRGSGEKRVKWWQERGMERFPVLDTTVSRSDSDQALLEHRCTGSFLSRLPFCVLSHTYTHTHIIRDICPMQLCDCPL